VPDGLARSSVVTLLAITGNSGVGAAITRRARYLSPSDDDNLLIEATNKTG
jgi:hypothetical protein